MEALEAQLGAILNALRVEYHKMSLTGAVQFSIERFGVVVCGINRVEYKQISDTVEEVHKGWRVVYITTQDNLLEKKDDIVWALMQSGYLKWLRSTCTDATFRKLMFDGNFANKIIAERLKRWGDSPKYKYFKESDEFAKGQGRISEYLSKEPAFFDFMPEK